MPSGNYKILCNERISGDNMWVMKVAGDFKANAGQFFMLRAWDRYPVLSRPISVHDLGEGYIAFMYRVVGEGTEILSKLVKGDDITLAGPYGNGFPLNLNGKIALVGGGMGVAPLLWTAKQLDKPDVYLGFREEVLLENEYRAAAGKLITRIGGTILDDIDYDAYDYVFACGPLGMEKALANMVKGHKAKVYVSLEKHMACGMGACLVCTCFTSKGNKKVCKDGPVFLADEVLFDEL